MEAAAQVCELDYVLLASQDYFAKLAAEIAPHVRAGQLPAWRLLTVELENFRQVLEFALAQPACDNMDWPAYLLSLYYSICGPPGDAVTLMEEVVPYLRQGGRVGPELRLIPAAGTALTVLGKYGQAEQLLSEALDRAEQYGDGLIRAQLTRMCGILMHHSGQYENAEALHQEGIALARQLVAQLCGGEGLMAKECLASLLNNHGYGRLLADNIEESEILLHESLDLARSISNTATIGYASLNLADCALQRGAVDEARILFESSLEHAELCADTRLCGYAHCGLAQCFLGLGDVPKAEEHAERSLELHTGINYLRGIGFALAACIYVALERNRSETAVGFANQLKELLELPALVQTSSLGWTACGDLARSLGDLDEAISSYRIALKDARSLSLEKLIEDKLILACMLDDRPEGAAMLNEVEYSRNTPRLALARGLLLLQRGEQEAGLMALRRCLPFAPGPYWMDAYERNLVVRHLGSVAAEVVT